MEKIRTSELFGDENSSIAYDFIKSFECPWQALPRIREYILSLGKKLSKEEYDEVEPEVWVAKGARVEKSALICAPAIICDGAQIRHCAYIRGDVIVGKGAVVGNSTELKNCILFDGVQVPHYNYVGDSILGRYAHMGAGSIISNVRSDKKNVRVLGKTDTGLRKFGAIVGDNVEIGCGAVLNPGTIVCRGARVYPLALVRGCVPQNHIYKREGDVAKICAE